MSKIIQIIPAPKMYALYSDEGEGYPERVVCLALIEEIDERFDIPIRYVVGLVNTDVGIEDPTEISNFSRFEIKEE